MNHTIMILYFSSILHIKFPFFLSKKIINRTDWLLYLKILEFNLKFGDVKIKSGETVCETNHFFTFPKKNKTSMMIIL